MNKEGREELAALSFTEKVRLLEKLRDRTLALIAAGEQLAEKKKQMKLNWSKCELVEIDPLRAGGRPLLKDTHLPVEDIISKYESGASVDEISKQLGIEVETIKNLLIYAERHYSLARPV
ncbi:MAG TPA: DUF433 domain-containing protein [Candidatus Angelobacter sp.]|nr:DUF433 domain-containing protein [Candidatus Angelobacter sp.]